jgi:hypothetical protein
VKRKYRSGTEREAASIAMAQIKTLVTALSRGVQLLDSEIATEEERTPVQGSARSGLSGIGPELSSSAG